MRTFVVFALLLALLSACTGPRAEPGPAWETNDPARRVYGGGV